MILTKYISLVIQLRRSWYQTMETTAVEEPYNNNGKEIQRNFIKYILTDNLL